MVLHAAFRSVLAFAIVVRLTDAERSSVGLNDSDASSGHMRVVGTHLTFFEQARAKEQTGMGAGSSQLQGIPQIWTSQLGPMQQVGGGGHHNVYVAPVLCAPDRSLAVEKDDQGQLGVMQKFNKGAFVHMYDKYEGKDGTYILMENAFTGGDLKKYIYQDTAPDLYARLELFRRIALGVRNMHEKGYIHRDLKPDNVLISGDCSEGKCYAKVAGLGLACSHEDSERRCQGVEGTALYMAPEAHEYRDGDFTYWGQYKKYVQAKNDVWALGLILYELMAKQLPIAQEKDDPGGKKLAASVQEFDVSKHPVETPEVQLQRGELRGRTLSQAINNMLAHMLERDPAERWTSHEVLIDAYSVVRGLGPEPKNEYDFTKPPDCWGKVALGA